LQGFANDYQSNVYIINSNSIKKCSQEGETMAEFKPDAPALLDYRAFTGIDVDSDGNVYTVDKESDCILSYKKQ